jgi:hypothetical protein
LREQLEERIKGSYPDEPAAPQMVGSFFFDIDVGDYIVARKGRSTLVGIGNVTRTAYFDETAGERRGTREPTGTRSYYPHFQKVEWHYLSETRFPHFVFTIKAISRIRKHLNLVKNLLANVA